MDSFDNNPYVDEDGEPLMDPDDAAAASPDRGLSPAPDHFFDYDDGEPAEAEPSRPRKRLIKKVSEDAAPVGESLDDWVDPVPEAADEEEAAPPGHSFSSSSKKRKGPSSNLLKISKEGSGRKERKERAAALASGKSGKGGGYGSRGALSEKEEQELWDNIAYDPDDDQEGVRTVDDDAFIDDSGVDPAERFGSDNDASPSRAPQAEEGEEDDEINQLFRSGKKKKKVERSAADIGRIVEQFIADFEVAAELDAELNRQSEPAINKLIKLPMLTEALSKKKLQQEFLDHGVLNLLKNWLEPLPDGSLPNIKIRSAILKLLTDFPIDLEQHDGREQLKRSGLGKVIMFLSRSDEETTANRKLAKELVDKWSRPIFNKSTRFEDMRRYDDDKIPYRRAQMKKASLGDAGMDSRDEDLDADLLQGQKSGQGAARLHASRPEALAMDFVIRPQSKIDPEMIRARAKQVVRGERRIKMNKKLQQLKAPKRKNLQASKISVEGRGMVKYL